MKSMTIQKLMSIDRLFYESCIICGEEGDFLENKYKLCKQCYATLERYQDFEEITSRQTEVIKKIITKFTHPIPDANLRIEIFHFHNSQLQKLCTVDDRHKTRASLNQFLLTAYREELRKTICFAFGTQYIPHPSNFIRKAWGFTVRRECLKAFKKDSGLLRLNDDEIDDNEIINWLRANKLYNVVHTFRMELDEWREFLFG